GGIAVNASVVMGLNAIAGEWGHNPLPWPDPDEIFGCACFCGKHGCIETWLSGPALAVEFLRVSGRKMAGAQIALFAAQGDLDVNAVLSRYEERLAKALT